MTPSADELYDHGPEKRVLFLCDQPRHALCQRHRLRGGGRVIGAVTRHWRGPLRWASLASFLTYANQYTKPFNEVTGVLTQLQTALASAERLLAVIDQPTRDARTRPDALAPAACEGRVDVAGRVDFSYVPGSAAH